MTLEIMGAFLGMDTDQMIFRYFRPHWSDWFLRLRPTHRTTFVRQAANLLWVKAATGKALLRAIDFDPYITDGDRETVPVCRLARAYLSPAKPLTAMTRGENRPSTASRPISASAGRG